MQATIRPSTQQTQPQMRTQRTYAMTAPQVDGKKDSACYESMLACFGSICGTLGSIPLCCCFPNPFKEVQQGTVGLITRFGRFTRATDPGLYKINPFCEQIMNVDIRMRCEDIPRQVALTKDNVSVQIDSVLYWDILDPYTATFLVANVQKALIDRAQTSLRMVMGNRTLQDTIEHRDQVATEIRNVIDEVAETWGVRVESLLIKDVILGPEIIQNMSAAATQRRLGESKVIAAQAEVNSAKLMREAADILNSPAAMQIRYLETLQQMANHAGTKVIFMPTDSGAGAVANGLQSGRSGPSVGDSHLTMKDAIIYEKMADRAI